MNGTADIFKCQGGRCPFRHTCQRFILWMAGDDDDEELATLPAFHDGKCDNYMQIEYYGQ